MSFFTRRAAAPPAPTSATLTDAPPAADDPAADPMALALRLAEAVGALVRLTGAFAHDTPGHSAADTRAEADAWRRRLSHDGPIAGRDWEGAVRFATERRRAEHAHVERALDQLRDAVWTLIRGLHAVAAGENAADGDVDVALQRLAGEVAKPDPEAVRRAAQAAVRELGDLAARRARRRDTEIRQLGQQLEALDAALDAARREGATDPLTGLGNRRALDEALARTHAAAGLWGRPATLVLFDVDGLKTTNDRCGHQAGDEALEAVAGQLARAFLRRGDTLVRHGGDEFAAVLPDTAPDDAERLARRVVEGVAEAAARVQAAWRANGASEAASPAFGVSAGVARLAPGESADGWIARADAALYEAKRSGRGTVRRAPEG